jgi:hypothetical protein
MQTLNPTADLVGKSLSMQVGETPSVINYDLNVGGPFDITTSGSKFRINITLAANLVADAVVALGAMTVPSPCTLNGAPGTILIWTPINVQASGVIPYISVAPATGPNAFLLTYSLKNCSAQVNAAATCDYMITVIG